MSPELLFVGGLLTILGGLFAIEKRIRQLILDILAPLSQRVESIEAGVAELKAAKSDHHTRITLLERERAVR